MNVRPARLEDVASLRELFGLVYGADYPYPDFYDFEWLARSVYDDRNVLLVAEEDGRVLATGSLLLDSGGQDDLVAELGRLLAPPGRRAARAARAAQAVVAALLERQRRCALFAFGEIRTVHPGAQRLAEEAGWRAVGFEPQKFRLARRESMAVYAHLEPAAAELRRNNPRVIPEVAPLAQTALAALGLPADAVVEDDAEGYPTQGDYVLERLRERGIPPLLRIQRGRVRNREVCGHSSLSHGFFRIGGGDTHYLVAREGATILGAAGFVWDPVDSRLRLFELIEFDEAVKGALLARVDALARDEFGAAYQEVDVSAHSPRMQRTLERLGFVPVAYLPAMVFAQVERHDVVRFAKLNLPYDPGTLRLQEGAARVREVVERTFLERAHGLEITDGVRSVPLFAGLPDGELRHLARIAALREFSAGAALIREGDRSDRIFVLLEGEAEVRWRGRVLGVIRAGETCGEMALVEQRAVRSASVVLREAGRAIEIPMARLAPVLAAHPRLSHGILYNLARGLSQKLRATRE